MDDESIQVQCYAGARGAETPRAVVQGGRHRAVARVIERWIEEARDPRGGRRQWFRVEFEDGEAAAIYLDLALDMWFLSRRGATSSEAAQIPSTT